MLLSQSQQYTPTRGMWILECCAAIHDHNGIWARVVAEVLVWVYGSAEARVYIYDPDSCCHQRQCRNLKCGHHLSPPGVCCWVHVDPISWLRNSSCHPFKSKQKVSHQSKTVCLPKKTMCLEDNFQGSFSTIFPTTKRDPDLPRQLQ